MVKGDEGEHDRQALASPIPRIEQGARAALSAREVARRLLGEEVGGWKVVDVRASSGVRITLRDRASSRELVVVVRPAGQPGFVTGPRFSAMKVGASQPDERPLLSAIAERLRAGVATFGDGEIESALAAASRAIFAPVTAGNVRARALRPEHAELRLNLACNQACFFCNCDGYAPNMVPDEEAAIAAATRLGEQGVLTLTITGGEPTLRRMLTDVAGAARRSGVRTVMVQTNAVALADGDLATRLRDAGVSNLFVSLHSSIAEVSDRITGAPGTHALTLRGLDAALAAGLVVETNFVISRLNMTEPVAYVRWLRGRFGGRIARRVFSFVAPVGAQLRNLELMPRISEAVPHLRDALDACAQAGEPVRVAGVCGLPLCVLKGYEAVCDEADNPAGVPLADDRTKVAACSGCAHEAQCSGFWRTYFETYGEAEMVPIARLAAAAP